MSEKQLDFVHIFDHQPEEEKREEEIDEKEDPVDFNESEEQAKAELERIHLMQERKEQKEKMRERRLALMTKFSPKTSDFEEFMPEIESYMIRMHNFRKAYETAKHPEKIEIYQKMVRPDIHDDPVYQESARLYLKYIDALHEEERPKHAALYDIRRMNREATKKSKAEKKAVAKPIDLRHGKNAAARLDD